MRPFVAVLCLCLSIALCNSVSAQQTPDTPAPSADGEKSLAQQLKENPDDGALLDRYLMQQLGDMLQLIANDLDKAEARLKEMDELVQSLEPTTDGGKEMLARVKMIIASYQQRAALGRVTLEELAAKLRENPNVADTLSLYQAKLSAEVAPLIGSEPAKAEQMLASARTVLAEIRERVEEENAQRTLGRLELTLNSIEEAIALERMTLEEVATQLRENPNSVKSLSMYRTKLNNEASPLARTEPEKAAEAATAARQLLDSIKEQVTDQNAQRALEQVERVLTNLDRSIETGRRLASLIGSDAAPLSVEAWVNGEPLTDADLKGKVVLLDFWAVWCGPCIATFPHLREWQEKYSEQGLMIIGLTRYYNFVWDEEAGGPKRLTGDEKATPEQEQEMLTKFAALHDLHHRFAIQSDNTMSDYYAVTGIPHVVVVDQKGKIRLFRIGSGEENAQDVAEMIEKLLAEE